MLSKLIGLIIVIACITVSVLRGLGIMDGDFIIHLILLSQMFILGYIVNVSILLAKDIVFRYNRSNSKKIHTYKIDFAIPKLKLLIEIKDNHIWHKEQVQSGKWDEKVNGVEKFLQNNSTYGNVIYEKYININLIHILIFYLCVFCSVEVFKLLIHCKLRRSFY